MVFCSTYFISSNFIVLDNSNGNNQHDVERNKLLIPFVWGMEVTWITLYLTSIMTKLKESEQKSILGSIPQGDLEYLSLIKDALESMPDRLDGISDEIDSIRREKGESGFLEILKKSVTDYKIRQNALSAISKGLENVEDPDGLNSTLRTVIDETIGKNCPYDSKILFYRCMYAYITAWLVCSIHNNQNGIDKGFLPIDSIFYQDPNRKYLYIETIEKFSERLEFNPSAQFFKTKEILSLVQEYLKYLVTLISRQNPTPKI